MEVKEVATMKTDSKVIWVRLKSRKKNQNGVTMIGSELFRI